MITLGGRQCTALTLTFPAQGRWVAHASVADGDEIVGGDPPTITTDTDPPVRLVGSVLSAHAESRQVTMVGGPAVLSATLAAQSWRGADVRTIAKAALGDHLSTTSAPAVMAVRLSYWTRFQGTARAELRNLAAAANATWRALDNGAVWLGTDTYPEVSDFEASILDRDATLGTLTVATALLALRPNQTWRGHRISRVEYSFDRSQALRAVIWLAA